jgi:hypothetical protein
MGKTPDFWVRGSLLIVVDWRELFCNADVVDSMILDGFLGLTWVFVVEVDGLEGDGDSIPHARLDSVCAGEAVEEGIDGAVFLHDDDDVLDGRTVGRWDKGTNGVKDARTAADKRDDCTKHAATEDTQHKKEPETFRQMRES